MWTKMVSNWPPSKAVLHANFWGQCHFNCGSRRGFCEKCTLTKPETVRKPISLGAHNFRTGDPKTMISSSFDRPWRALSFVYTNIAPFTYVSLTASKESQIKDNIDIIEKHCKPGIVYVDEPTLTGMYPKTRAYIWSCACHLAASSAYAWAGYCCAGVQNYAVHGKFLLWEPL